MKEELIIAIAYRLPRRLVYWCAIRLITFATTGQYETTDINKLNVMDALKRWGYNG